MDLVFPTFDQERGQWWFAATEIKPQAWPNHEIVQAGERFYQVPVWVPEPGDLVRDKEFGRFLRVTQVSTKYMQAEAHLATEPRMFSVVFYINDLVPASLEEFEAAQYWWPLSPDARVDTPC